MILEAIGAVLGVLLLAKLLGNFFEILAIGGSVLLLIWAAKRLF